VSNASGVQIGWKYGAAFIWHSWTENDSTQSDSLLITAPGNATATGFTVEWNASDVVKEYNSDSDAGFGLNFWGALENATIKIKLVYKK